eukprot:4556648-Prymnesium_polylepis.1
MNEMCEADGECGTTEIDNCWGRDVKGPGGSTGGDSGGAGAHNSDVYKRVECHAVPSPPSPPAPPPVPCS